MNDADGWGAEAVLDEHARVNAQVHFEQWDVILPTARASEVVRVEWPSGGDRRSTVPSAAVRKGEAWLRVHSARRPADEARAWLDRELGDGVPAIVCVIGAGLGYVIEELFARSPSVNVLALEPEPGLIPWLLGRRDWRDVIRAGRLLVVPGPAFEQRMSAWRMLTPLPTTMPVLTNPVLADARCEAVAAARAAAALALKDAISNEFAGDRFAGTFLLNTLRNMPALAREAPCGGLLGLFRGKVAVVAGAGPSLNRNIEELRPHRDRVVLIAAGTALKPLVAGGVPPDLVVAVDPGENTHYQFEGVHAPETFLVADPGVDPAVFRQFVGRTFAFRVGQSAPWPWLLRNGVDPGQLRSWGSVITAGLHIAVRMGCGPIVFIGTDLAYTAGQSHAHGTFMHGWVKDLMALRGPEAPEDWAPLLSPRTVTTEGLEGPSLSTSPIMLQFRDWLRHESAVLPVTMVNATGAGILCGGRIVQATVGALAAGQGRVRRDRIRKRHQETAGDLRARLAQACRETTVLPAEWTDIAGAPAELEAVFLAARTRVGEE